MLASVVIYAADNEGCSNPPDNVRTPGDVPDILTVGATDGSDLIAGLSRWEPCPDRNDCPADLDGDCTVSVGDLPILLANWG